MLGYISSFAAVGFGVRCYQLAIMKRNIFEKANLCPPSSVLDQTSAVTSSQQALSQDWVTTSTTQSLSSFISSSSLATNNPQTDPSPALPLPRSQLDSTLLQITIKLASGNALNSRIRRINS
ncbi:hypothetical protein BCR35DRAFT_20828 [Leucosporidium creatinivorum]|uniref:Uncharacterized protein n=1 Tax=Leucosporidium creatinivorum TaxID=106004 RepID=A0A1Y2CW06_9BASI|nr:hypothetical protein BCR35DRAFT_20828 [Leucosporidium creatinivorum]